jgi:hypothetical protein
VELSVGLAALVVSIVSLFVARHQAQVMDRQLAASVWPLLEYSTSNVTPDGVPRAVLSLRNTGIGPLRVRSFRVTLDSQPIGSLRDLRRHCCDSDTAALRRLTIVTSYIGGRVLPAGEGFDAITVRYDSTVAEPFRRLQKGLTGVHVRFCYCSVLDDCWVRESRSFEADPTPVPSCAEEMRGRQFVL